MPDMSNKIFQRGKSDTRISALISNGMMKNQTTIFKNEIMFTKICLDEIVIRKAKNKYTYK